MQTLCQKLRQYLEQESFGARLCSLRLFLIPGALLYAGIMYLRRSIYAKVKKNAKNNVPVISIGNITAGGTGKTPCALYLAEKLGERKMKIGIAARGYGSGKEKPGDEEMLFRQRAPEVIYAASPRRKEAVSRVIEQGAEVVILDDGFQHLAQRRNLDLVLIDAVSPFGGGWVFPAGLLREPLTALRFADIFIVTRTDQVSPGKLSQITEKLHCLAPEKSVCYAIHKPVEFYDFAANAKSLTKINKKKVALLSGIARPESFSKSVAGLGATIVFEAQYSDHHFFTKKELLNFSVKALAAGSEKIIVTEKDAVKLGEKDLKTVFSLPVWVLKISLCLTENEGVLGDKISEITTKRNNDA